MLAFCRILHINVTKGRYKINIFVKFPLKSQMIPTIIVREPFK